MSGRGSLLSGARLFEVAPDHVDEGERIGFLHEDKAAALGRLMAVDGQRTPINVRKNKGKNAADKPWVLVTGMHRLIGARIENLTVWAIEVEGKPEDIAEIEASENTHRRPLGPIERAKFTAALVRAAQERIAREHGGLKQHQIAVRARWDRVKHGETRAEDALADEVGDTCRNLQHVYGWEESVGDALGMARDSIYRDLRLHRLVVEPFPDLAEALSKHPVVGENASQLKLIAQVQDENSRRRVIEALLADDDISADDARIAAGVDRPAGPAPMPHQKHFNTLDDRFSRLGSAHRRQWLQTSFVAKLTPGEKRELRDRLNDELRDA